MSILFMITGTAPFWTGVGVLYPANCNDMAKSSPKSISWNWFMMAGQALPFNSTSTLS